MCGIKVGKKSKKICSQIGEIKRMVKHNGHDLIKWHFIKAFELDKHEIW